MVILNLLVLPPLQQLHKNTGIGKSTNPRFCENRLKKLRSSACCRQENATFYPLILGTWGLWICRSLYNAIQRKPIKCDTEIPTTGISSSYFVLRMEKMQASDAQRSTCLTFCRDTITRLADKSHLQKGQIETLLSDRVSKACMTTARFFLPSSPFALWSCLYDML